MDPIGAEFRNGTASGVWAWSASRLLARLLNELTFTGRLATYPLYTLRLTALRILHVSLETVDSPRPPQSAPRTTSRPFLGPPDRAARMLRRT